MEIVVKKDELNAKLVELFTNNLRSNAVAQNLDEEEINAHLVLNKKKILQDAANITNLVFGVYGKIEEQDVVS